MRRYFLTLVEVSAFPLLQQQRAVARDSAAAQRLALIAVAARRLSADDVVIGETASSVTRDADGGDALAQLSDVDAVSPVLVQIPPQVPDGFREAHFQYERLIPVF